MKEKKSYAFEMNDGEDDSEGSEFAREQKNNRRGKKDERILSAYSEYQEQSTDIEDRRGRHNGFNNNNYNGNGRELTTMNSTNIKKTTPQTTQNLNSGPPPLLSQRRHSMSSAPISELTSTSPNTATAQAQSKNPTFQPKPVQAPPLLSQQRSTTSSSPEAERDDRSVRSSQKTSPQQTSAIQNPMQSEPESDASKSIRSNSKVTLSSK